MIERLKYWAVAFGAVAFLAAMAAGAGTASAASGCVDGKLKAIGKKEASLLKCQAKNAAKPDAAKLSACETKATDKFTAACSAAGACSGSCPTCESNADSCESNVASAFGANSALLKAASKLAKGEIKCYTKAAAKTLAVDFTKCMPKAQSKFTGAGGSPGQQATVESNCVCNQVTTDGGGCPPTGMVTAICGGAATTTTSSTTTSSTTSTTAPANTYGFTTLAGTSNCGGAGLMPPADPPFSGALFSDTGMTSPISGGDLGLGCLYIGGGNAINVPADRIPDYGTTYFARSGGTLSASAGTSNTNCSQGQSMVSSHCISEVNTGAACTSDSQCETSAPGSCAPDANCFYGPPLPIPNGGLSTCVLNIVKNDASGTLNAATGDASISLHLISRVYLTGNNTAPCPRCVGGKCERGPNKDLPCTTVTSGQSSLDCPPQPSQFLSPLDVDLTPLTTTSASKTDAGGNFCMSQANPGAFGIASAEAIVENGSAGVDLTDMNPHPTVLVSVFCIPQTGSVAIDTSANLPGPGAIGLNTSAQLH